MSNWWEVTIQHGESEIDPESVGWIAIECGASGSEQISDGTRCFLQAEETGLNAFLRKLSERGFSGLSYKPVEERNWVQECIQDWHPISAGKIEVVPVVSPEEAWKQEQSPHRIFVVPGTGFGDGAHPSTRIALELMQHDRFKTVLPRKVLDLGTGSGILSIACEKLYQSQTIAIDNDGLAIEAAKQTLAANKGISNINLELGIISLVSDTFNLIVANVYAEVLCGLEQELYQRLTPDGCLILSGIMKEQAQRIESTFHKGHWHMIQSLEENGWIGYLFARETN